MNKKINLGLLFTLLIIGLFSPFSIDISAQNKVSNATEGAATTCAGKKFVMPASISVSGDAREMPMTDRVDIWKTQLAYHLATGRFSKAQNEFILEMLMFFSPETFAPQPNRTREEEAAILSKIFAVFTKEKAMRSS